MKVLGLCVMALATMVAYVGCAQPPKARDVPVGTAWAKPSPADQLPPSVLRFLNQDGAGARDFTYSNGHPFTPEQIRAGMPDGLKVVRQTAQLNTTTGEKSIEKLTFDFSGGYAEGAFAEVNISGLDSPETEFVTWEDLYAASELPENSLRYERRLQLAVDNKVHDCFVYVSKVEALKATAVLVYAKEIPGMPMHLFIVMNDVRYHEQTVTKHEVIAPAFEEVFELEEAADEDAESSATSAE